MNLFFENVIFFGAQKKKIREARPYAKLPSFANKKKGGYRRRSMARILVTGKYVDKSTYVLTKENGTIYMEIHEGEVFKIDNQLREWIPVRVPKKKGKGTILMCRKFGDSGRVI